MYSFLEYLVTTCIIYRYVHNVDPTPAANVSVKSVASWSARIGEEVQVCRRNIGHKILAPQIHFVPD